MNAKAFTFAILGGLLFGGLIGFTRPYWADLIPAPEEAPESLGSYMIAHPLQGACDRIAGYGVSLFWSLPEQVMSNRLVRSVSGAPAVPVFIGPTGTAARFTEFRDTGVAPGSSYSYTVETDAGLLSNTITISVDPSTCPTR